MLQDSINWLDAKKRVEPQISRASDKLESMQEITYTVDDVKKLNNELKVGPKTHVWISQYWAVEMGGVTFLFCKDNKKI